MILGIGIDTVEIKRFAHWHTYAPSTLCRIFSQEEIDYCLSNLTKSAERFAARFAAREAFFKAISSAYPTLTIPFLTVCRSISITKLDNQAPVLNIDWERLSISIQDKNNQPVRSAVPGVLRPFDTMLCIYSGQASNGPLALSLAKCQHERLYKACPEPSRRAWERVEPTEHKSNFMENIKSFISLTHTKTIATAFVILEH